MAGKWDAGVLGVLQGRDWTSPTTIAYLVRNRSGVHSSWASPICLRLVKAGKLERNERGHYRIKESA